MSNDLKTNVLIIGGGITGLVTALQLNEDYLILERDEEPGGLLKTRRKNGFSFDQTGHYIHSKDQEVKSFLHGVTENKLRKVSRKAKILFQGRLIDYPFQDNCDGLNVDSPEGIRSEGESRPFETFRSFLIEHFGKSVTDSFFMPYTKKVWGTGLDELTAEWCRDMIPAPSSGPSTSRGYHETFYYPEQGGIGVIIEEMSRRLKPGRVLLKDEAVAVNHTEKWVQTGNRKIHYETLVSTMPLNSFIRIMVDVPEEIRSSASALKSVALRYLDVAVNNPVLNGNHWVYIPEPEYPFFRLGCYSNIMPSMAPPGCSSLYVEMANDRATEPASALTHLEEILTRLGCIKNPEDILFADWQEIPCAYVIFNEDRSRALGTVKSYLNQRGIHSIGRYGKWAYESIGHAVNDGIRTAGMINRGRRA